MKEIKVIIEPSRVKDVLEALRGIPDNPDVVLSEVTEYGNPDQSCNFFFIEKQACLEVVVPGSQASEVVDIITNAVNSSGGSSGRIIVTDIDCAAEIRDIEAGVA